MRRSPPHVRQGSDSPYSVALVALLLAVLGASACTPPSQAPAPESAATKGNARDTEIKHEPCDPTASGAVPVDINGDRRPDITHVMRGGREVCRVVDLNLDGAIDAFVYYDASGRERRRESDYDRDGRPDEIASMVNGLVVLKERETNYDDKLDTWDFYEGGRLVRRERDSDGDSIVDQWWTFNDPTDPKCALVSSDRNVDGKPDPDSVVDLCADQRAGRAPPSPPPAPSSTGPAEPPVAMPTPQAPSLPPPSPSNPPPASPR
jgi:hypothetical protein